MAKRKFFVLLGGALLATAVLHAGCAETAKEGSAAGDIVPSKNIITKKVSVSRFDAVHVGMGIKVNCRQQAGANDVTVRVPENLEEYLVVKTGSSGALEISFKFDGTRKNIHGNCNTEVDIVCGELNSVEVSSGARLVVADALVCAGTFSVGCGSAGQCSLDSLVCAKLDVDASSAGKFKAGKVRTGDVVADLSSAASIEVRSMDCASLRAGMSSAAKMDCSGVVCRGHAVLDASSASHAALYGKCEGDLSVEASSAAKVHADGFSAVDVKAVVSSGASVTCRAAGVLTVDRSSGGKVGYAGEPKKLVTGDKGVYRLD